MKDKREEKAGGRERGMALAQKLAQFKNQQDRLQATLAKIPKPVPQAPSKAAASSSRKAPQPPPSATPVIPFAQRFSFQNDQEKLQQIATIRKSPVGAQIKRVLDLLLEVGSGRVFFLFLIGRERGEEMSPMLPRIMVLRYLRV